LLKDVQPTPKTNFDFNAYDNTRIRFDSQLASVVGAISSKLVAYMQANDKIRLNRDRIRSGEEQINFYQNQVELLDGEKEMENATILPGLEQQLKEYEKKIADLKASRKASKNKANELKKEKAALDTDEDVVYWKDQVSEERNPWYGFGFLGKTCT
ncbi:hypothetical protein GR268_45555, partial [Rhizobium leguminosarum]|nr:hypothetical protein [Rhizobium leguminosarum]